MDGADHLAEESQCAADDRSFFLNVHMQHLLAEFNQKLDAVPNVVQLEHVPLEFEIEKNLADDHLYAKVEHLIVELDFFVLSEHVEFKVGLEYSFEERHKRFYLNQVVEMVSQIHCAV